MNDLGPALHSSRTAAEIAALVAGSVEGAEDTVVRGIDTVEHATKGDLTFIGDARHARHWSTSEASVAMVTRDLELGEWDEADRAVIRVEDADQAMIQVLELIEAAVAELADHPPAGVHPDARVDPTASIAEDATIGPFAVVGPRCRIGSDACIESGTRIYADAVVGDLSSFFFKTAKHEAPVWESKKSTKSNDIDATSILRSARDGASEDDVDADAFGASSRPARETDPFDRSRGRPASSLDVEDEREADLTTSVEALKPFLATGLSAGEIAKLKEKRPVNLPKPVLSAPTPIRPGKLTKPLTRIPKDPTPPLPIPNVDL